MESNVLCTFCNHPVTEKDGTIYGSPPWEQDNQYHGSHWACENKAESDQEIREFQELIFAEARYRGQGMW